jgi:hypothetical protein
MDKQESFSPEELSHKISALEERLNRVELLLRHKSGQGVPAYRSAEEQDDDEQLSEITNPFTESKVFEYGLAWIGSAVLLLGMIFFMSFVTNKFGGIISFILGLSSATLTFLLSGYLKRTLPYMAAMFKICGHLLVYYSLLKLHFFESTPAVENMWIVLLLLILSIAAMIYHADKLKGEFMSIVAIILLVLTALFADSTYFTLSLLVLAALSAMYLFTRNAWKALLILSIFIVYFAHTVWLIGNPVAGHPLGAITSHQNNIIFLFLYGTIYSLIPFVKQNDRFTADIYNAVIIINGLVFSILLLLIVVTFYPLNYVWIFLGISLSCLLYSIILNYRIARKFDASFYANFSFMALSIAVYGNSGLPGSYIFLGWQSLVVLAMAIWFRSSLIVRMNTLLYSAILVAYIATTHPITSYDISFTLIAIISAWILNWQKDRLLLKTEIIRNVYLTITFFAMLYTLYFAVPKDYITISWGIAAVFYMLLSVILKNVKFRWMAILTLIVTVIHLFIFDLAKMEQGYRIIAFIFIGLIILGVSFYYTKKLGRRKDESSGSGEENGS